MRDQRITATCGCICEVSASYNWADESITDVEVNIVELVCEYHRRGEPHVSVCARCGNVTTDTNELGLCFECSNVYHCPECPL